MLQPICSLNLDEKVLKSFLKSGIHYCNEAPFDKIKDLVKPPPTITALDIFLTESENSKLLTFNETLDKVLGDEISCGCVTELSGFPGSGKTQICFHLALSGCMSMDGNITNATVFVSTNYNFAPHRLKEIALNYKRIFPSLDVEKLLDSVNFIKIKTFVELLAFIKYLENWLKENKIKLLIIDSISYPLRQVNLNQRTNICHKILRGLQALAVKHNFPIIITNDLTTRIFIDKSYNVPSFGDTFFHCINSRIILSKNNNSFSGTVEKSLLNRFQSFYFSFHF